MNESAQSVELEPDWEEGGSARSQPSIAAGAPSRLPILVAIAALAMLAVGSVVVAFLWPGVEVVSPPPAEVAAAPTTGSVQVRIEPVEGSVYLDDVLIGAGADVLVPDVAPGTEHTIRVEAPGHLPSSDKVTVAAGERVRVRMTLQKEPAVVQPRPGTGRPTPPAPNVPTEAAGTSTAAFTSTPSGAEVLVEGRSIGRTPVEWQGAAGVRVGIEYRLAGHETARFSATMPSNGGRVGVDRALSERVAAEGKVSVNVSGTWADIWIDGKKVGQTPGTHTLTAGVHEIRVRNEGVGLDETRKVTVKAGETTSVPFTVN